MVHRLFHTWLRISSWKISHTLQITENSVLRDVGLIKYHSSQHRHWVVLFEFTIPFRCVYLKKGRVPVSCDMLANCHWCWRSFRSCGIPEACFTNSVFFPTLPFALLIPEICLNFRISQCMRHPEVRADFRTTKWICFTVLRQRARPSSWGIS